MSYTTSKSKEMLKIDVLSTEARSSCSPRRWHELHKLCS